MQNVHFSPPQLAPLFGVNVSTIKRWVDKSLLKATITAGGHRRISSQELQRFLQSNPTAANSSYVIHRLQRYRNTDIKALQRQYENYIFSKDPHQGLTLLRQLYTAKTPLVEILEHIISPTLQSIGYQWQKNIIEIYDEHRMSFSIRNHLLQLQEIVDQLNASPKTKTALLACAPGEHHEIPLLMTSILLTQYHWNPVLLGINISPNQLGLATKKISPNLICISKVYSTPNTVYLRKLERIGKQFAIPIILGGRGWNKKPSKNSVLRILESLKSFDRLMQRLSK